jgi:hypothetical protein
MRIPQVQTSFKKKKKHNTALSADNVPKFRLHTECTGNRAVTNYVHQQPLVPN